MGSRAGDIHGPKGHVNNSRSSKEGVRQRFRALLVNSVPIRGLLTFGEQNSVALSIISFV